MFCVFFFKQKTAYEMRISDWSSDVCSSDLGISRVGPSPISLTLLSDTVKFLACMVKFLFGYQIRQRGGGWVRGEAPRFQWPLLGVRRHTELRHRITAHPARIHA